MIDRISRYLDSRNALFSVILALRRTLSGNEETNRKKENRCIDAWKPGSGEKGEEKEKEKEKDRMNIQYEYM